MGTVKDMNILAKKSNSLHILSDEEMIMLRKILIDMLEDIIRICDKHNICYMLAYGSCLGAVRHKGFIPWDDDLDLLMPRKDLNKFVQIFPQELSNKYEITSPNTSKESKNIFTKIYKKNTLCLEMSDTSSPFSKGIYVDVFALDYAVKNKFLRKIKAFLSDVLCFTAVSVLFVEYPCEILNRFMKQDKKINLKFNLRKLWGLVLSIISHRTWTDLADKFMQGKKSNFLTVATGRNHYYREVLPQEIFLPVSNGIFEGLTINLPANTDKYLTALYGKYYMQLPPEEKRERHFVLDLKFNL